MWEFITEIMIIFSHTHQKMQQSSGTELETETKMFFVEWPTLHIKQLSDEVEHDIMNYQNRGLCYLPKPKAEADNTDTRF